MEPMTNPLSTPLAEDVAAAFPQYEIEAELGRGGMGAVFRARHRQLERTVAIKVLLPEHDDPELAERFGREARALASLQHPNIVGVQDVGQVGSLYFLVMDFVDGADLRQLLRAGELTVKDALAWVPQICDALQYAHDHGVVHRDIKPENVLIDQDGNVQIVDFGLAKLRNPDGRDLSLTRSVQGLGTPHYMAPEQVAGAAKVDHRADIYSLGVMFYELLTGELPIGRFAPPSRRCQVAKGLDDVVMKTLESDPARRIQSAREMKARIERAPTSAASAPGAISRYRTEVAQRKSSAVDEGGRLMADRAWLDGILFPCVVLPLMNPWAEEWVAPSTRQIYDVWDIHLAGVPAWLVSVVALAVVIARGLRFRGYAVPPKSTLWLLIPAACYCGWLAVAALISDTTQVRSGLWITLGAIVCWLLVEVRYYLQASRSERPSRRTNGR